MLYKKSYMNLPDFLINKYNKWKQNEFPTPKPPFKGDWKKVIEKILMTIKLKLSWRVVIQTLFCTIQNLANKLTFFG